MPVHRNEDGRVIEEPTRRKQESGRREGGGGAGRAPEKTVGARTDPDGGGGAGKGDRFGVPPTRRPGRGDSKTRIHRPGGGGSPPATNVHREGATSPPGGAGEEGRRGVPPTVKPDRGERPVTRPPGRPIVSGRPRDPMADPPVGWLVVVDGPGKGHVATLGIGRNAVGRGRTERVPLDYGDSTISRIRHCTITYEPRRRTFHVGPGDGDNLTYVDDEAVHETQALKPLARVQLGATVLRFVPLCGPEFSWDDEPE